MIHIGRYINIVSADAGLSNAAVSDTGGGGVIPVDSWQYALMTWAITNAFIITRAERDANSALVNADVQWPDGVNGTLIVDKASDFPGVIDAYRVTYASTPMKTITQAAVTRDANGAVISQPLITIT